MIMQGAGDRSVDFYIYPSLAIGVVIFSVIVSVVAGYFPARRGANLDPVIAIKDM